MSAERKRTPHILVVEDDRDIRDSLMQVLELEGFGVDGAADGIEALEYLRNAPAHPDLILLDLMMPRMDGYEFRRRQLESAEHAAIPVAVLTADGRVTDQAAALGVDGFLRKPMTLQALLTLVNRVLAGR